MPDLKLGTDVAKDQLFEWLLNALKCELFPKSGDSLANVGLPAISEVSGSCIARNLGDESHVIALHLTDGKVLSLLVKHGDYRMVRDRAAADLGD